MNKYLISALFIIMLAASACGQAASRNEVSVTTTSSVEIKKIITNTVPSPSPTPQKDYVVNVPGIRLYSGPGTMYEVIGQQIQGDYGTILERNRDCSWVLATTVEGVQGWINSYYNRIEITKSCEDISDGIFRPRNGEILVDNFVDLGGGALEVRNNGQTDMLLVLTDESENPLFACFVYAQGSARFEYVPDGEYLAFYLLGSDWNLVANRFMQVVASQKIDEVVKFVTAKQTLKFLIRSGSSQ